MLPPSADGLATSLARQTNPTSAPVTDIANFLVELFAEGLPFRLLSFFRSGRRVTGKQESARLLRARISLDLPDRITQTFETWKGSSNFFSARPNNFQVILKQFLANLTTLLCLVLFCRDSNVQAFDHSAISFLPDGGWFLLSRETKVASPSMPYLLITSDPSLCVVVRCLCTCLDQKRHICPHHKLQLLISYTRPHFPVPPSSFARLV